jgi:hypothetical protein
VSDAEVERSNRPAERQRCCRDSEPRERIPSARTAGSCELSGVAPRAGVGTSGERAESWFRAVTSLRELWLAANSGTLAGGTECEEGEKKSERPKQNKSTKEKHPRP